MLPRLIGRMRLQSRGDWSQARAAGTKAGTVLWGGHAGRPPPPICAAIAALAACLALAACDGRSVAWYGRDITGVMPDLQLHHAARQ